MTLLEWQDQFARKRRARNTYSSSVGRTDLSALSVKVRLSGQFSGPTGSRPSMNARPVAIKRLSRRGPSSIAPKSPCACGLWPFS